MSSSSTSLNSTKSQGLFRQLTALLPSSTGRELPLASSGASAETEKSLEMQRNDLFNLVQTCQRLSAHEPTCSQVAAYERSDAAQRQAMITSSPAQVEYIAFDSLTSAAQELVRKTVERDGLRDRIERLGSISDVPAPLDAEAAAARDAELLTMISRNLSKTFTARSSLVRPGNDEHLKTACGKFCNRITTEVSDANYKVELFGQMVSHVLDYAEADQGYQGGRGRRLQVVSSILGGLINDLGDAARQTKDRGAVDLHKVADECARHIALVVGIDLEDTAGFAAESLVKARAAINELR